MIDLSPEKNIARDSALFYARTRANHEKRAIYVYVGPPGIGIFKDEGKFNTWFVRSFEEEQPEGSELYHTQAPENLV